MHLILRLNYVYIFPGVRFPNWYDGYQDKGYDVDKQTSLFPKIFVGTEARDYFDPKWGGHPVYMSFFIQRWLGAVGADRGTPVGGGWFDSLGTDPRTYVEQGRQTILGGARESFMFHYGGLQEGLNAEDVLALRQNQKELLAVAAEVGKRELIGIAAFKPVNSHGGCGAGWHNGGAASDKCAHSSEVQVFDFLGMLGLPVLPTATFPHGAKSAFFSIHALKDPSFVMDFKSLLRNQTAGLCATARCR